MTLYDYDKLVAEETRVVLCGVDEAGRGPLAGPVYAAAVILPPDCVIEGLDDSKKLTEKKREKLFGVITSRAVAYCVASADRREIDGINILNAALLAMKRAVEGLGAEPGIVLVDGNAAPELGVKTRTVVGGDAKSACIAAASVLAKVARDRHMLELDEKYPGYGFAKHKGYGTKLHYERLDLLGPCEIHRETFLKKWRASR